MRRPALFPFNSSVITSCRLWIWSSLLCLGLVPGTVLAQFVTDGPGTLPYTLSDAAGELSLSGSEVLAAVDRKDITIYNRPADKSISCDEKIEFGEPSFYNHCSGSLTITVKNSESFDGCCVYTRTWTATNRCGKSASYAQHIRIVDDTPPVLTPVHPMLEDLEDGDTLVFECGEEVPFISTDFVATDTCANCPSEELTVFIGDTRYQTDCVEDGYVAKIDCWWYAEDRCGNRGIFTITMLVEDTKPPVFTSVPADKTVNCEDTPVMGMAEATDDCGSVTITFEDSGSSVPCGSGSLVRTYTATDDCGNTATAQQTITIKPDTSPPVFTSVPSDLTVDCEDTPVLGMAEASDNCGSVTITFTDSGSTVFCGSGSLVRTYTATDNCGNSATAQQTITIKPDTSPPVFTHVPADATLSCDAGSGLGMATAEDACNTVTVTFEDSASAVLCGSGSYVRTFTATDDCGNTATAKQTITQLPDTSPPVFTFVPADATVSCNGFDELGMATAEDACNTVTVTFDDSASAVLCGSGSFVRTFTATDDCGNSTTAQQTITQVADTSPPFFTFVPADLTIDCSDADTPPFGMATADDDCNIVSVTFEDVTGDIVCGGASFVRVFRATDDCGNQAVAQQTISVASDSEGPVFTTFPPDMKIMCGDPIDLGMPTASDNCGGGVTLTFTDEYNTDTTNCANGYGYDIYRTWKATDICGNMTTSIQAAWVVPQGMVSSAQFAFIPEPTGLDCTDKTALGEPMCNSPCGELTMTTVDFIREEDCINGLSYTRVWQAIDDCGNTHTAYQSLAIPRDQVSVFTRQITDKTMQCGEAPSFDDPVCDDCPESKVIIVRHEDTFDPAGCWATRTWTAMDRCGNMESVAQTITREDSEGSVFSFTPADLQMDCQDNIVFAEVSLLDACSGTELTYRDETKFVQGGMEVKRTWTAVNGCGRQSSISQTISQVDRVAPVFTFIPADEEDECGSALNFGTPVATDACSAITLTFSDEIVATETPGIIRATRTWTATDELGNTAVAKQNLYHLDRTAPVFILVPADIELACGETADFGLAQATDVCGHAQLSFTDEATDGPNGHSVTRYWTAVDQAGNAAYASQTIRNVPDTQAPVFTQIPADFELACGETADFGNARAIDGCSEVQLSFTDEASDGPDGLSVTRYWTAVDESGNTSRASQTILYAPDTEAPVFTQLPTDIALGCGETADFSLVQATDGCSEVQLSYVDEASDGPEGHRVTRSWTAVDESGNESRASQTILYAPDTEAPVFTQLPTDIALGCGETADFSLVQATDGCSEVQLSYVDEASDGPEGHRVTRSWTAVDESGNESRVSQTILYAPDTEAPVFTQLPTDIALGCGETADFSLVQATDGCSEVQLSYVDEASDGPEGHRVTRSWTAVDESGNTSRVSQTILYAPDTEAPVFTRVPDSRSIECGASVTFGQPEAIDNCSQVSVSFEDLELAGDCSAGYSRVRVWTATDESGNQSTASQSLTVEQDLTPPSFTFVPQDQRLDCGEVVVFGEARAADNCSQVNLLTVDELQLEDGLTVHMRTWTAVDDCGNLATASQRITLLDSTAPGIVFSPEDKTIECLQTLSFDEPLASDDCSEVSMSFTDETQDMECGQVISRKWRFTDASGNSAEVRQNITVIDRTPPEFLTALTDKQVDCGAGDVFDLPEVIDECSSVSLKYDTREEVNGCNTIVTRIWTARDDCGNIAQLTQRVTFVDETAPVVELPETMYMSYAQHQDWSISEEAIVDDCSGVTIAVDQEALQETDQLSYIYTISAADACGQQTTQVTTVIITDYDPNTKYIEPQDLEENDPAKAPQNDQGPNRIATEAGPAFGSHPAIDADVQLAPNPTRGQMDLYYSAPDSQPAQLIIYDMLGRQLQVRDLDPAKGFNKVKLQVEHLKTGTYLLLLKNGSYQYTEKFVKID